MAHAHDLQFIDRRASRYGLRFLLASLALLSALASAAAPREPLVVRDDSGQEVRLEQPTARIISLAPHATELVYEVGAGDQLVGVSDASDYPPEARQVPHVGGYSGLDLERIVTLRPDLVIAWTSGTSQAQIAALRRAGITVFQSDPKSLEDIESSLERLGVLTGHAKTGARRAQILRDEIADLNRERQAKVAADVETPVKVFYQVWDEPLYTVGGPHLISKLIRQCGGINIFADVDTLAPEVSPEAILRRHPDLIVTDPQRVDAVRKAWIERGLKGVAAPSHVVGIDPNVLTRPSSRIVDGARALCHAIAALRPAP